MKKVKWIQGIKKGDSTNMADSDVQIYLKRGDIEIIEELGKGRVQEKVDRKSLKLDEWLNTWADFNKHPECVNNNLRTKFGDGYKQAIRDVIDRTKIR